MNKQNELIIRGVIISLCLIFIGYFIFDILNYFYTISKDLTSVSNFNLSFIITNIILIFLFYLILSVGIYWKNYFKFLTKFTLTFAILFLTLGSFLLIVNSNSGEITDSIQDSIDYILVGSLEDIIFKQFEIPETSINIEIAENSQLIPIYNKNISLSQANLLSEIIEINQLSNEETIEFSKFFISITYDEIKKNMPELIGIPVTKSQLLDSIENSGYSSIISSINLEALNNYYSINDEAYLILSISDSQSILSLDLTNPQENQIEQIWNKLNFDNNVSYNTKKILLQLLLSQMISIIPEDQSNSNIPIETLSYMIPEEIKTYTKYDLFSNDLDIRVQELKSLRNNCLNDNSSLNEICSIIALTNYETLMSNLNNKSNENMTEQIPMFSIMKDIETKEKVEILIDEKTNKGVIFIILSLVLFSLAFLLYYLHFKFFDRELIILHIPYFIFKTTFYHFLPTYILTGIFYWLISSDFLKTTISKTLQDLPFSIDLFLNIPMVDLLLKMYGTFFLVLTIFLIFYLGLYLGFYFILKQKVKQVYE